MGVPAMRLRNNVTFKATIPFDQDDPREVAETLASVLGKRTRRTATIDAWRGSGYELDFTINGKKVHFAMVHVEDPRYHFYGQVSSYVGWIWRLLGYQDDDEIDVLILAIHDALTNDPAFKDVLWHEAWYDEEQATPQP
jgi:hypothetical protein